MSAAHRSWHPLRLFGLLAATTIAALGISLSFSSPARATPSVSDLQTQIHQQSQQFDQVVEQYNKITEDQKKTKSKINALDKKIKPLERKVDRLHRRVDTIAMTAYKGGTVGGWNALLDDSSPSHLLNGVATLDRLSASQSADIRHLANSKRDLDSRRHHLAKLYDKQSKHAKQLKAKKAKISKKIDKLKDMRVQAYGQATETANTNSTAQPPNVSGRAGAVVSFAYAQLGKPYAWAAAGPGSYDCSGLTLAAWKQAGVNLPHVAADQYNMIAHINRSQIQPGDLVFYENLGHVAIYVGSGKVIHAPTFGEVVKVSSIDMMPVYGIGRP